MSSWWWPFSNTTEEHENTDTSSENIIRISGDHVKGFRATTDICAGEAVAIVEDHSVVPCDNIEQMYGVALYEVDENEGLAVVERPCEVRVQATGNVDAGVGAKLKDSMTWTRDAANRENAIAIAGVDDTGHAEIELRPHG